MNEASLHGHAPAAVVRPPERDIYAALWSRPEYRAVAPGEYAVPSFMQLARPRPGAHVLDLGCGTGRAGLSLAIRGLKVTLLDFAPNCLDDTVSQWLRDSGSITFLEADLTEPIPLKAEYGFCTDVMEHIPPHLVDRVLDNCLLACQKVYFQISTVDDVMGGMVGHPLHLTVQPHSWWLEKFKSRECNIFWTHEADGACSFYVSAWRDAKEIVEAGVLNVEEEQAKANVRFNIAQGWKDVQIHPENDYEVMIVGSAPSLAERWDQIRELREKGYKLVTLNGAYNACLERGLIPSAQIIVDAREHNARFAKPVVENCIYLISSQCDPSVLEGLPKDRTYLWHAAQEMFDDILREHYKDTPYWPVPGGSTVLLRAIPLLRNLGCRRYHLFGCDSCLEDGKHHAFDQKENDGASVIPIIVGGRTFMCHPYMAAQAQEFMDLIRTIGDVIDIEIYGDGLLAHIVKHAAELFDEMELSAQAKGS